MISWQNVPVTEPPFTRNVTEDEINHFINTKQKKKFPDLP